MADPTNTTSVIIVNPRSELGDALLYIVGGLMWIIIGTLLVTVIAAATPAHAACDPRYQYDDPNPSSGRDANGKADLSSVPPHTEGMYLDNGTLRVMVRVGSRYEPFQLDTGAAYVQIPLALIHDGYLGPKDLLGEAINLTIANGSSAKGRLVTIRELRVAGWIVRNVQAVITPGKDAPLLLGQSVLNVFKTVVVDYQHCLLTLNQ